jgi:uncharacterized SAM-binding protein YcdF (DUF218 family)
MTQALDAAAAFAKVALRPASATFVVAALGVGVALTFSRRLWRVAPFYWLALFSTYTVATLPLVAHWLVAETSGGFTRIERAADAQGARTIVVLGAGSRTLRDGAIAADMPMPASVMRTLEGARLYHLLGDPTVILSGGVTDRESPGAHPESEAMRGVILRLGVPDDHLVLESISTNTRSEAEAVRTLLGPKRLDRILLVTSPMHMRRSMATFTSAGLKPVAAISAAWPDRSGRECRFCPSHDALELSDAVVYEQVAWLYYWAHGWLGEQPAAISH